MLNHLAVGIPPAISRNYLFVMSLQERIARYKRIYNENVAWQLLRTDNAPLILAFLGELFAGGADVAVPVARASLDVALETWRALGVKTDTDAAAYLRSWADQGYLREQNGLLSMSDATHVAIRFAEGLERRDLGATASNLRIVQDAVATLAVDLSLDYGERVRILIARKNELEAEIEAVASGKIEPLPEAQQRERVRTVIQLARMLTGNFRQLEEDIRRMDQVQRQQMIENLDGRGIVLENLLDTLDLLSSSSAGRAFKGFHRLLADDARSTEFRSQLRMICESSAAEHLNPEERRFLRGLVLELNRESNRVIERRTRAEEALRAYIESGAYRENKRIEAVLAELKRVASSLHRLDNFNPRTPSSLKLRSGRATLSSLPGWRLKTPAAEIMAVEIVEHRSRSEASDESIDQLRSVRQSEIAQDMLVALRQHGAQTLATLVHYAPIHQGLEEVVIRLRIAREIGGTSLDATEWVRFSEHDGLVGRALIPSVQISAGMFPADLETLNI